MSLRRPVKTTDSRSFEGMRGPADAEVILAQLASAFFGAEGARGSDGAVGPGSSRSNAASAEPTATLRFQESGILYVDESTVVLDANPRAVELFGGSPTGKLVSELFTEGVPASPPFRSTPAKGRRLDGSSFHAGVTASQARLFGASFWILSVRDLNEDAQASAATRRAEARYRTLIEQIPAVTFMASLEEGHNELYIGPQIESLLGYTQKEWLDDPVLWFRRMHPDDQERWNAEFARGCAVGGPFRADCRFFARDGRTVWVHGEARIVRDEHGRAQFIQGVAFDITEIKEAEERMREAQETIVKSEKLAAIGRLAASVGHELRNPLAAIRNAWFYLENKLEVKKLAAQEPRIGQFASVIQNEIERCAKIIGELLDFSRERPLHRMATPATELVRSALSVVVKPAETIRIHCEISKQLPVPNLDADQFRQVLVNLIQNAVEAVEPERGVIEIRVTEQDGELVFEVRDNGKGISPELQAKVFEPLFTTKLRGTGLGLAIVDGIVKRHGGQITVKSEVGRGTVFRVRVPVSEATSEPPPALGGASDLRHYVRGATHE